MEHFFAGLEKRAGGEVKLNLFQKLLKKVAPLTHAKIEGKRIAKELAAKDAAHAAKAATTVARSAPARSPAPGPKVDRVDRVDRVDSWPGFRG